jgi:predicted nucleic acid-binding protein
MPLTLADIPANVAVFLDANLFVYHYAPHPSLQVPCQQLLERIAAQELMGYTSAHVLTNVAHRIMTLEAVDRFGWPMTSIAQRLQRHRDQFRQLTRFREVIDEIPAIGIHVVPITAGLVSAAAVLSQQNGLLSGDALVVAVMREHGLTLLASHDADFDRVPGLTRYAPA